MSSSGWSRRSPSGWGQQPHRAGLAAAAPDPAATPTRTPRTPSPPNRRGVAPPLRRRRLDDRSAGGALRVGTSTVRGWLQNAGIPRRLPGRPSQAPGREELVRLYVAEGLSTTQIGQRYGVSQQTALRWLRAADVALRPQASPRASHPARLAIAPTRHRRSPPPPSTSRQPPASPSLRVAVTRHAWAVVSWRIPRQPAGRRALAGLPARPLASPAGAGQQAVVAANSRRAVWLRPRRGPPCAAPRPGSAGLEHPVDIETGPPCAIHRASRWVS